MDSNLDNGSDNQSYTISDINRLTDISRTEIYRAIESYEQSEVFRASAVEKNGGKYYPRSQWDGLLASIGRSLPDPDTEPEIVEAELVPEEAKGTLAKIGESNQALDLLIQTELQSAEKLADDLGAIEEEISEAEVIAWQKAGVRKGVARFKVQTQAEQATFNQLQQRKMRGGD